MKRYFTFLIVFSTILTAYAGKAEYFDNENIQRYNGSCGKWEKVSSYANLCYKMRKYGCELDDVLKYNENVKKGYASGYCFIPFSSDYINELKKEGKFLKKIQSGSDEFVWPISVDLRITSNLGPRWGRFHKGVDMAVMVGTPVYASKEGRVEKSRYFGGYGNVIVLEHRNNFSTKYAHNSVLLVKEGDFVEKGQLIALAGSSGRSTGAHLHFEIRCNSIPLDPMDFLPFNPGVKQLHTLGNWKIKK